MYPDTVQRMADDDHPIGSNPSPRRFRPGAVVVGVAALVAAFVLVSLLDEDQSSDDTELAEQTSTSTSATSSGPGTSPTTTAAEGGGTSTIADETPGASDQGGQTVVGNDRFTATIQSTANRSSGDFTVDDGWQVRWEVPTAAISLDVFGSNGDLVESIEATGLGWRSFAEGGSYRVEIISDGSRYTVVISDDP